MIKNLLFYLAFLFFGGAFVIGLSQFVVYNGLGNLFEYKIAEGAVVESEIQLSNKIEITDVMYQYVVDDKTYSFKESISSSAIKKRDIDINTIYYNSIFPSLSYFGDNSLSLRKAKVAMVITLIPLIFFILIYRFADLDKWMGIYTRGEFKSSKKK